MSPRYFAPGVARFPLQLLLLPVLLPLLPGCGSEESTPDCVSCHEAAALFSPGPGADMGARDWLTEAGTGLVLVTSLVPGQERFVLPWPRRGHHDQTNSSDCLECHPTEEDGRGHGADRYPVPPDAAGDEEPCGECHVWLPTDGITMGFENSSGARPSFEGSLRPIDLLTTGDDAHARIFREGFSATEGAQPDRLFADWIAPGCIGCHSVSSETHGDIPACTDCHRFGTVVEAGSSAALHANFIAVLRAGNDPAHVAELDCIYCHGFSPTTEEVHRPACYNCHLSGHRPEALFWP